MVNWKKVFQFFLFIIIGVAVFFFDSKSKKERWEKLRTKELTVHTEGIIWKLGNARKSSMTVYSYSFSVGDKKYSSSYTMHAKYKGIEVGAPVGVIYLKEDPYDSRIIFTDEDFNWIE